MATGQVQLSSQAGVGTRRLPYVRSLDGIRGLAIAVVLAFHAGAAWAAGGYLGVSAFFTLSGFLITSLLVAEHRGSGRIALRSFWARRLRRLAPAGLLALLLAAAVARSTPTIGEGIRGDLLAALGQVANWRWIASGQSYAEIFSAPSPVLHHWSLSIEEQYYLLFPPVVAWVLLRSRARLAAVLCTGVVGSWALLVAAALSERSDIAYYSTPTRVGELLIGGLLALWLPLDGQRSTSRLPDLAGAVAVGGLMALVAGADRPGEGAHALALPATALLTALLIFGAVRGRSTSRLLSSGPLVWLGRISYGVYVFHWPLFLFISPERVGLHGAPLTAARLAASLLLASASYAFVERPILRGAWPVPRLAPITAAVAYASVAALVVGATANLRPAIDLGRAQQAMAQASSDDAVDPATPHVAVFGDSSAIMLGFGLLAWATDTGDLRLSEGVGTLGCGLITIGERRSEGRVGPIDPDCPEQRARWGPALEESGADVALVHVGAWDVTDLRLPGDRWRHLGDPELDEVFREAVREVLADLTTAGADRVLWVTTPPLDGSRGDVAPPKEPWPEWDPRRAARLNELVREVAQEQPVMEVLDLAGWLADQPPEQEERWRPDGVHLTESAAREVAHLWLGEAVVRAAAEGPRGRGSPRVGLGGG